MDHSDWKGSGFSLFPMPPTPPANRARARVSATNGQHAQHNVPLKHRNSDLLQLLPAPLKVRKKKHATDSHASAPESAWMDALDRLQTPPSTPDQRRPFSDPTASAPEAQATTIPSVPASLFDRRTPRSSKAISLALRDHQASPRDSASIKPPSSRSSLWWDPHGQVDRKKLSVYLSQVLDSSFKVGEESFDGTLLSPNLNQVSDKGEAGNGPQGHRPSYLSDGMEYCLSPESIHGGDFPIIGPVSCSCPSGTVICQCHSSPEFERFRKHKTQHKAQPSISSTTCYLSVPRARFHSTLGNVNEPETPTSPPALMYDSEGSDGSDWSLPNSPTVEKTRQEVEPQTPTPAPRPRVPNTYRPPVPSFSLPFSHGRQIRPKLQYDRRHTGMPWERQDASPTSTIPTLASISTISTFTFDFGDNDNATEYDPFEVNSVMTEIRTWEPISKAKPVLVHCRGPSPQSIKYGHLNRYKNSPAGSRPSEQSDDSAVFI